jgi:hypothetical protein
MRDRPVTLTPSMRSWGGDRDPLSMRRMAFLGGPALSASAHELDAIARIWRRPDAVDRHATCAGASQALERADLVHVAAHGVFRSDNPFFSAIRFSDGLLTVLELAELARMPQVVVLSSCDAAASTGPGGADGEVVVGTAIELRRMGARIVVAPASAVDDAAAAEYSIALHTELAAGRSVDDATTAVRGRFLTDDDPSRRATGAAFQVFGGRATRYPLERGPVRPVPSATDRSQGSPSRR